MLQISFMRSFAMIDSGRWKAKYHGKPRATKVLSSLLLIMSS
jgi:hypothetical protein